MAQGNREFGYNIFQKVKHKEFNKNTEFGQGRENESFFSSSYGLTDSGGHLKIKYGIFVKCRHREKTEFHLKLSVDTLCNFLFKRERTTCFDTFRSPLRP